MATELRGNLNSQVKLFERFSRESVIIIIVVICVFFAVDSFLRSGRAESTSNKVEAKVDYVLPRMQDEIDQTRIRNDLYSIYMQELYVELKNQGFDPPPLPENE